ncbi:MAG: DUF2889 domain-containing protein [Burkholderiaceae bacterium]|nr:DUF2889 domain-containing protein [Burkholderiaceae bacterium]
MPIQPTTERTPLHTRTVTYQGYARADGLWDIEGELRDSKHYDHPNGSGTRRAGEAVHHLWLRVTLDERLCIHAIATTIARQDPKGALKKMREVERVAAPMYAPE